MITAVLCTAMKLITKAFSPPEKDSNNFWEGYLKQFHKFCHALSLCLITAFETDADKLDEFRRRYDNSCSNTEKQNEG